VRRIIALAGALALSLAAFGLAPVAQASEGPSLLVQLRSVEFDAYTGNVTVKVRVACSNAESASWNARLVQEVRAKGSRAIPCDGERHRSRIVLDPVKGRFTAGPAELTYGGSACDSTGCVISSASVTVTLTHTP
jgi:hypothetical protein